MKDTLEVIKDTALKALHREKNNLTARTVRVDSMIAAFNGTNGNSNGSRDVRAGRKLSMAHRRAIKEGIRKSKLKNGK